MVEQTEKSSRGSYPTRDEALEAWRKNPADSRTWGQVVGDWEKEARPITTKVEVDEILTSAGVTPPSGGMAHKLKELGSWVLLALFFLACIAVPVFFISGALWASEFTVPVLSKIAAWLLLINLAIVFPMALFKKTRAASGVCMVFSSFVFGALLWFLGLILTFAIWGWTGIVIGLLFFGVGIVPLAILATLLEGSWSAFGFLLFLCALTYGTRFGGLLLKESGERGRIT